MGVNYNDQRFLDVEAEKKEALTENEQLYSGMVSQADSYYKAQQDAAQDWADKQTQLQNEQTEFAIDQIEQQKAQAEKDYIKEQSGAYVDWQKQSGAYGANAEAMAAQGMTGTGYSESSQVSMYNTYQNRVATAREAFSRAVLNYDNAIKDARLQNNAALAEIAYQALQTQLELALEGFQYKNQLLIQQANMKLEIDNMYYGRYQDVLQQINQENALAEEMRQYNLSLAEQKRQYDEDLAWEKWKYKRENEGGNVRITKSGGGGGGSRTGSRGSVSSNSALISNTPSSKKSAVNMDDTNKTSKVTNRHGSSWVEIPGHGRFSWAEVYAYVKEGVIKETAKNGNYTYTWVGKPKGNTGGTGKNKFVRNVTPDKKGYTTKQWNLVRDQFD